MYNMYSNNSNNADAILQAVDDKINSLREKLERLKELRGMYLEQFKPGAAPYQKMPATPLSSLSSHMINNALLAWPKGKNFTPEDLFREIERTNRLAIESKRNASALLCSFLSKRVKKGELVKVERGLYCKPEVTSFLDVE